MILSFPRHRCEEYRHHASRWPSVLAPPTRPTSHPSRHYGTLVQQSLRLPSTHIQGFAARREFREGSLSGKTPSLAMASSTRSSLTVPVFVQHAQDMSGCCGSLAWKQIPLKTCPVNPWKPLDTQEQLGKNQEIVSTFGTRAHTEKGALVFGKFLTPWTSNYLFKYLILHLSVIYITGITS